MNSDQLVRFSFDQTNVRGEIVHLNNSYQEIIHRHRYPSVIAEELGKLMAATAILSATLKFEGRLTLQARLSGNVQVLQAETNEKGQLRAIARYDEHSEEHELIFADGQLAITLEPNQGQRYQGITSIQGGHIAQALEEYFLQSEQLPSQFWLVANEQYSAGMMIQKTPMAADAIVDPDAWDRIHHLAATIKEDELLNLNAETILHRLFHEEHTRVFPATPVSFFCTCSKPRTGNALKQLGYEELDSMLMELSAINITCEFCQQSYSFDRAQVESLFPERNLQ